MNMRRATRVEHHQKEGHPEFVYAEPWMSSFPKKALSQT
jgi:hypothetical protein